jgi:DNA-directed RNA polymerase subunit M/transcription elongation factor TFIIS
MSRTLSWDVNNDGDKVEVFVYNNTLHVQEPTLLSISISEIKQAADSKKFQRMSKINEHRKDDMPNKSKANLSITVTEAKAFAEWILEHAETCPYIKDHEEVFTQLHFKTSHESGIGPTHIVTCDCGESIDITDVSSW